MKFRIKITAFLLTVFFLTLSLTACSRLSLDEKTHNVVKFIDENTLEYQGNTYYLAPMMFIQDTETAIQEDRGYVYIGWTGFRFFYIDTYYGDSVDSPYVLYESRLRLTYFREDYDYKTDTFKIEGTNDEICFGEDLIESSADIPYSTATKADIVLSSVTHTSLDIKLNIFSHEGTWYARSMDFVCFELSENFYEILVENQIVT